MPRAEQELVDEGALKELRWMLEHSEPIINFTALEVSLPPE